jgi:hypothetical protein
VRGGEPDRPQEHNALPADRREEQREEALVLDLGDPVQVDVVDLVVVGQFEEGEFCREFRLGTNANEVLFVGLAHRHRGEKLSDARCLKGLRVDPQCVQIVDVITCRRLD